MKQSYEPEIWAIKKDDVYEAIAAINTGIMHTRGALADHDVVLGRTTPRNKWWAEQMEADIAQMETALKNLQCP